MKFRSLLELSFFGITTVLWARKDPIVGSVILTDRCNLSCRHCAVSNLTGRIYSYVQVKADMLKMYASGVRILLLYGGEPFLWEDNGITLRDLVLEARQMGFLLVHVVTNGTLGLDLPEADLLLVSLDGGREAHNEIRGDTYDLILDNIQRARSSNICLYVAINQINIMDIEEVCELTSLSQVKVISFNFHTPYLGTEYLQLTREQKQSCGQRITKLIDAGYPVLNLKSALPYIVNNTFETPCYQCMIMENGQEWVCGRCIEIEGLCQQCGFFFAGEYSLVFNGNIPVIMEMVSRYLKYL